MVGVLKRAYMGVLNPEALSSFPWLALYSLPSVFLRVLRGSSFFSPQSCNLTSAICNRLSPQPRLP